jgi:hypothetical protein
MGKAKFQSKYGVHLKKLELGKHFMSNIKILVINKKIVRFDYIIFKKSLPIKTLHYKSKKLSQKSER